VTVSAHLTKAQFQDFKEMIDVLRNSGAMPLGLIAYNVERDAFIFTAFTGIDLAEVNALLDKIHMQVEFTAR
jgi:hypothetical protein